MADRRPLGARHRDRLGPDGGNSHRRHLRRLHDRLDRRLGHAHLVHGRPLGRRDHRRPDRRPRAAPPPTPTAPPAPPSASPRPGPPSAPAPGSSPCAPRASRSATRPPPSPPAGFRADSSRPSRSRTSSAARPARAGARTPACASSPATTRLGAAPSSAVRSRPKADLADAVAASCAIPGFYHPVTIAGRRYVDGGMYSTSNLDILRDAHMDLVICLNPTSSLHPTRA